MVFKNNSKPLFQALLLSATSFYMLLSTVFIFLCHDKFML